MAFMHCLVFRRGYALQAPVATIPAKRHRPTANSVTSPGSTINALLVLPPLPTLLVLAALLVSAAVCLCAEVKLLLLSCTVPFFFFSTAEGIRPKFRSLACLCLP